MKIAFLDRDGTINKDYDDATWATISEPEILPFAIEGMKAMLDKGYRIIIVTNQYIIGDGVISLKQYEDFTKQLLGILKEGGVEVLDVFYCPHSASENCECMKPRTGMIEQALLKYPEIDLSASFFCGDSPSDRALAEAVDIDFYGIGIEGKKNCKHLFDVAGNLP